MYYKVKAKKEDIIGEDDVKYGETILLDADVNVSWVGELDEDTMEYYIKTKEEIFGDNIEVLLTPSENLKKMGV